MPVYSRAGLSRTLVVVPFLTVPPASAVAYEFRDAAIRSGRVMQEVE
jgi:hypothetical protein